MKIHLLSDLHLERGSYRMPGDLDFDVLVAAGDISDNPAQAIDFLAAVGKPVVFVLGNHDYWSGRLHGLFGASEDAGHVDMTDRLAEFRRLARGTQIHVLEREFVILKAGGKRVRFLGATLWSSYGNANPALMKIGSKTMNDTSMIGAKTWIEATKKNAEAYRAWQTGAMMFRDPDRIDHHFEPPVALDLHTKTVAWFERQLKRTGDWEHTVVVTHHWPSWDALVAKGLVREPDISLDPDYWKEHTRRPDREPHDIYRLAAYGSPLEAFIERYREQIDLWCCGHVHLPVDAGIHGVRVVANPRGYPYSKDDNRGNAGPDFDERKIVDLRDGVMPALMPPIEASAKVIDELVDELTLLRNYVEDESDLYLRDVMRDTFEDRIRRVNEAAEKITRHIRSNLEENPRWGRRPIISLPKVHPRWPSPPSPDFGARTREWEEEFGSLATVEPGAREQADRTIHEVRTFLSCLRRVHRKPGQIRRIQDGWIARALRRLAEHGIRARRCASRSRFPYADITLQVVDPRGLTHDQLMDIIDLRGVDLRLRSDGCLIRLAFGEEPT